MQDKNKKRNTKTYNYTKYESYYTLVLAILQVFCLFL